MTNTRPSRKKAAPAEVASSSVMKPVKVSSSSLESAAVAAPSDGLALNLPHFDLADFTNDPGAILPLASVSPDAPYSHPGAVASRAVAAASNAAADQTSESAAQSNTVPEFLYQLTKLLTDDNRDAIEWSHGQIEVHNPHKLESDVLSKYFRHSKYASFQRQLNYFGFRKLAGKGKMAPCSYTNDHTTPDIRSLLVIKRKASTPRDRSGKKRDASSSSAASSNAEHPVNPVLANILHKSSGTKRARLGPGDSSRAAPAFKLASSGGIKHQLNGFLKPSPKQSGQNNLAQTAVGKGIRHNFSLPSANNATESGPATAAAQSSGMTFLDPAQLGMNVESSLSELTSNYLKAQGNNDPKANDANGTEEARAAPSTVESSMLSRESSLVDLAMLPTLPMPDRHQSDGTNGNVDSFTFVDFPNEESFSLPQQKNEEA